jgi:hypothetical protein
MKTSALRAPRIRWVRPGPASTNEPTGPSKLWGSVCNRSYAPSAAIGARECQIVDDLSHATAHTAAHDDAELAVAERGHQQFDVALEHVLYPYAFQRRTRLECHEGGSDRVHSRDVERDEPGCDRRAGGFEKRATLSSVTC